MSGGAGARVATSYGLGLRLAAWTVTALGVGGDGNQHEPALAIIGLMMVGGASVLDATAFGYTDRSGSVSTTLPRSALAPFTCWSVSPLLGRRSGIAVATAF